ncbi:MAG: hypothetical protein ACREBB_09985 [Nitrosotalea sp.]
MKSVILSSLLIIGLLSIGVVWTTAEGDQQQPCPSPIDSTDTTAPPSSSVQVWVCSSYSDKAPDGTTVVLGKVYNNNDSPVTDVKVGVTFEDLNSNVLEYKTGTTLLQVVAPHSMAPFSISSTKADPSITQIAVNLAGFTPASARPQSLTISPGPLQMSDNMILAGTIQNGGTSTATNTRIYLLSYDAFQRVVAISTTTTQDIGAGSIANFTLTSTPSSRAKTFQLVAESDNYQSLPTSVSNIVASLPVLVSDTNVTSPAGGSYSSIPVDAPVKISSNLSYLLSNPQSYVYYVQVKKFGGEVAFIGNSTGVFLGSEDQDHTESISWTPDATGSYYVETYVWDSDGVPISSAGTTVSIVLVK